MGDWLCTSPSVITEHDAGTGIHLAFVKLGGIHSITKGG